VGDADVRPMGPRRWSLVIDRALVPHTPQWNGAVALALARVMIPAGAAGEAAARLSEIAAAELLLPMRFFRPRALRTDLTMDGVRELAMHFVAPIRLTVRQWLESGTWYGLAMLWREVSGEVRLRWRAASPGVRFPTTVALGAPAESVWSPKSRLYSTLRTGRPHHGVEEVRVGPGAIWWFTRFGVVRDDWGRSPGPALRERSWPLSLWPADRGTVRGWEPRGSCSRATTRRERSGPRRRLPKGRKRRSLPCSKRFTLC